MPVRPVPAASRPAAVLLAGLLPLLLLTGCEWLAQRPAAVAVQPADPGLDGSGVTGTTIAAGRGAAPHAAASAPAELASRAQQAAVQQAGAQLLTWQDELRQSTPEQAAVQAARLAGELAATGGAGAANGAVGVSAGTSLRLALLWLHTRVPGDAAKALMLLDNLLRSADPQAAAWQPWVRLLQPRALEQKRLEDALERQAAQAREQQRRTDQLNEKLEALKAIERSLAPRRSGPER